MTCCTVFHLIPSEGPVMEDLILNARTLFDEPPSRSPPVPSIDVARTKSTHTHGSSILSRDPPESADVQATGSTSRHLPGLGPSSSKSLTKGIETTTQEKRIPPRATKALPNSAPPDVGTLPASASVAEWRLNQSRLAMDLDTLTILQSPSESVLSVMSDLPISSVTSPQISMLGSP